MLPLDEKTIRASFVNATRRESTELTLPPQLADLGWDGLDYLGWRDPKFPRRGYLVVPVPTPGSDEPGLVGVILRQAEASPRSRAQCSWCQDVRLPNPVVFYSARRAGEAGRSGGSVGTLLCENFECSVNVRRTPPVAYLGFDVEAARDERMRDLRIRAAAFTTAVLRGT